MAKRKASRISEAVDATNAPRGRDDRWSQLSEEQRAEIREYFEELKTTPRHRRPSMEAIARGVKAALELDTLAPQTIKRWCKEHGVD